MTITARTAGAWTSAAGANLTPALPASIASGDMMVMFWCGKDYTVDPAAPAGWEVIGSATDGTVSVGNGLGSMRTKAYWKIATTGEAAPTIVCSTADISGAHIQGFIRTGSGDYWAVPVGSGGGDAVAGTTYSITISADPGITTGDMCVMAVGIRDDCVLTVPTFTATSVTFAAVTESPATALVTTSGFDMAADGAYRLATAGTSSAAAVLAGTIDTSETGSGFLVRLREQAAGTAWSTERILDSQAIQPLLAQ